MAVTWKVAERAFVAQRLGRVNVAFDDEVGLSPEAQADVGQNGFQFGQNVFKAWRNKRESAKNDKSALLASTEA